jgi:hypothetical protein
MGVNLNLFSYHVHKRYITQTFFLGGIWSSWKFHDNKQMILNLLHNFLIPKQEKIAISYI